MKTELALRKENGLTQQDLAKKAGVSQQLIGHYENGIRAPKLEKAILPAKAIRPLLDRAVVKAGLSPRHIITDKGAQFRESYRRWCRHKVDTSMNVNRRLG